MLCFPDFTQNFNVSGQLGFFQILWRKSLLVFCFLFSLKNKGLNSSVTRASSQLSILIGGVGWSEVGWDGGTHSFGSS
jgi:hypothetical protein